MFFQEAFDSRCKYCITCFGGIDGSTRYFGKYIPSPFVAGSIVVHFSNFPTDNIVYPVRSPLVHDLHKGLYRPQATRKPTISVSVNQYLVYFIDGHTCLQRSRESRFQVFQISLSGIGCHRYNGLFACGQYTVCLRITFFRFSRSFLILAVADGIKPYCRIYLRVGRNGDMRKPTVRCCPVPMHHVRGYLHDVARKQPAGGLSFFLDNTRYRLSQSISDRLYASANCCGIPVQKLHLT